MLGVTDTHVEIEADDKLARAIRQDMGIVEGSNGLAATAVRQEWGPDESAEFLERREASTHRGVAARTHYLGLDRPDAQYGIKEACRAMSTPTTKDLAKIKRLARYVQTVPRLTLQSNSEQRQSDEIHAFVDAAWAGCRASMRSTGGGVFTVGGMVVKSWCSTQGSIVTSTGESEFFALVRGSAGPPGVIR